MHANLPLALLSPLVPSVLSRVWAEMGPTFWKLQKCAAFRRMHRYQLHVALVVAFSFCEQNGAAAAKWKMGVFVVKSVATVRLYQRHLECLLGMTENDATSMQPWASRVWGPFASVFVAWDRFEVTMEASSEWLWR